MPPERYPKDIVLTVEDFAGCGWKEILAGADREGFLEDYHLRQHAFSDAAKQALNEGRQTHGKVLELLSDVCSMMLSPDSANEPFKPLKDFRHSGSGRSATPDDLSEADLVFFAEIVETIDDPWLKARLGDLVWLRTRKVHFAFEAIDAYQLIPLDGKMWRHGARDCWKRAIKLARMLGRGAGDRLKEMETKIIESFHAATQEKKILALDLADLLKDSKLGGSHALELAQGLESIADAVDGDWRPCDVRDLWQAASDWYMAANDRIKPAELKAKVSGSLEREADVRTALGQHVVAGHLYEEAIQNSHTISRAEREKHWGEERIPDLRARLSESRKKSLDEINWHPISTSSVDTRQIAEDVRNAVRGKELFEALKEFANLHPGVNAKELYEETTELLQEHPFRALFSIKVMDRSGRVIAKRPGMSPSDTPSEDDEIRIRSEMIRDYSVVHVDFVVQNLILPAQEILLLEHRLRETDFIALARQSPLVPIGRELLFGKALFAGYDQDFITALHLLVPQIEHAVRSRLKRAGVKTTTLDSNGIETENGLSSLMELPEIKQIFGEDLSFEIKALFCDAYGPNLRNNLAHGLLDDEACQSVYAIYAWWFGLKLVFNTFWNATRQTDEKSSQEEEA